MTVMLLQHTPLARYKLPPPPPPPPAKEPARAAPRDSQAMRYYRLWIYTCNAVLLASALGFAVAAGRVVADPRRLALPGLALYQPSFLYAYVALATQSGLLQVVGCLGALRLNERLLNTYWLLLLLLLFGDAIVGVVWVFRFDRICADLRPALKHRLAAEYGTDADFTALWDALQRDHGCCGVDGAGDFGNRSAVPESCCRAGAAAAGDRRPLAARGDNGSAAAAAAEACGEDEAGCADGLLAWLRHSADVLFVVGYCVFAFLKLCFVGILRYEIREMIQKIKMLHGETSAPTLTLTDADPPSSGVAPAAAAAPVTSPSSPPPMPPGAGAGDANATPHHRHHLALLTDAADSDTNSNCALLIAEDSAKPPRSNGNNNNYEAHELHELNRLLARHHRAQT